MGNVALLVFYCHRVCTRLDLNERREKERKKKKKTGGRSISPRPSGPEYFNWTCHVQSPLSLRSLSICNPVCVMFYARYTMAEEKRTNSPPTVEERQITGLRVVGFQWGTCRPAAATAAHNKQHGVEQTIKKRRKKNWNGKAQKLDNNAEERGGDMDKIIQHYPGGTMAKQHPVGDSIQER